MGIGTKSSVRKLGLGALWFVLHSLAAMPLAALISALAGGLLLGAFPYRTAGNVLFWLLTLAIGYSLGLFVNRDLRRVVPCFVWVCGLTWLALGINSSVRGYDPRWYQGCTATQNAVNAFFVAESSKCGGGESTLYSVLFTMPALTSIGYSIGALIGLKKKRDILSAKMRPYHKIKR